MKILLESGAWLAKNREFLPESSRSPFGWTNTCALTTRGTTIYAHMFDPPGSERELCLAEIANKVLSVKNLATGEALPFEQKPPRLLVRNLPKPDPICTTLAIEVDGEPKPYREQETFWVPD